MTRAALLAVVAIVGIGTGVRAQFARPATRSWTDARPVAAHRPSDPLTPLARRQRVIAIAMTRQAMTKVDFLPRATATRESAVAAVAAYAPIDQNVGTAAVWSSDECERDIRAAERQYGIPPFLLSAIAITESGRNGRPVPLAMNISGTPYIATDRDDMEATVRRYGGETASIDVGCTQINLHWHAPRFRDWRSLLEPRYNAEYAALYLSELRRRYGSWNAAVGSYHSNTPWKAQNYACLVSRRWSQIFGSERPGCGADIEAMARLTAAAYPGG